MTFTQLKSSVPDSLGLASTPMVTFSDPREMENIGNPTDVFFPLSHGQSALWFLYCMNPASPAYNIVYAARIVSRLDLACFRMALEKLVDRHTALRTVFAEFDGKPGQKILDRSAPYFYHEDGSAWTSEKLSQRLVQESYNPFNLEKGPLWRVTLIKRSSDEYILIIAIHHIVADFWSFALLLFELGIFYSAEKSASPPTLKPLRYQFVDYVLWEQELLSGPEGERLWNFWRRQLAGELPILNLPIDRLRPPIQTCNGSGMPLKIDAGLTKQLNQVATLCQSTLFDVMFAAFQILIYRYTGQEEILISTPRSGRSPRTARQIGYFVNPLAIRANLTGNPSFQALAQRVHQTVSDAFDHGNYPFHLLVERLKLTRDFSRSPLIQVVFAWQKTTRLIRDQEISAFVMNLNGGKMNLGDLELESLALEQRVSPFEIMFWVAESGDELIASMEYNRDLFYASTIARMLQHYLNILHCVSEKPDQSVALLPILSAYETNQVLSEWNQTETDQGGTKHRCIHDLIAARAQEAPESVALVFHSRAWTYQMLNQRANQLAHFLKSHGIKAAEPVAIFIHRSPEMIVAMLGLLKSGAIFMPIDPICPMERIEFMLKDAGARFILTQNSLLSSLPDSDLQCICLDTDSEKIGLESSENPEVELDPRSLAYIIYTSGSTGKPKGTMVQHEGLVNLAQALIGEFHIDRDTRFLQFASLSFDATIAEIFPTLLAGAKLYLAERQTLVSANDLLDLLRQQRISHIILPPSVLSVLPELHLDSLKVVISAGEACNRTIIDRWIAGRTVVNAYGPTEVTVCASTFQIDELERFSVIPIGRPIQNMQLFILDPQMNPVPVGVTGELYIGGIGLARGYINRPDLTAEKFVPDPFSSVKGGRLYRTGDLARHLPDGNVEFLGRFDYQVKIRGYRIELEEIETVLEKHPAIAEVLVMANAKKDKLFAYYTVHPFVKKEITTQDLRAYLFHFLPEYMVPANFFQLETMPLTSSGKIDRKALPSIEQFQKDGSDRSAIPVTMTEQMIAAIWQRVLQIDTIGRNDNFFDLGGHSLNMIQAQLMLKQEFGREISLVDMFKYPTVATLAKFFQFEPDTDLSFTKIVDRATQQKTAFRHQRQRTARIR